VNDKLANSEHVRFIDGIRGCFLDDIKNYLSEKYCDFEFITNIVNLNIYVTDALNLPVDVTQHDVICIICDSENSVCKFISENNSMADKHGFIWYYWFRDKRDMLLFIETLALFCCCRDVMGLMDSDYLYITTALQSKEDNARTVYAVLNEPPPAESAAVVITFLKKWDYRLPVIKADRKGRAILDSEEKSELRFCETEIYGILDNEIRAKLNPNTDIVSLVPRITSNFINMDRPNVNYIALYTLEKGW
jgi:hypothetical protein